MRLELARGIDCYFTRDARLQLEYLTDEMGLDADLALSVLEQLWDEREIYDFGPNGDDGYPRDPETGGTHGAAS